MRCGRDWRDPVPEQTKRERGNEAEGGIPQSPTGLSQKSVTFSTASEFKIKSVYCTDLILNVACKIKEAVQKLKFSDSPGPPEKIKNKSAANHAKKHKNFVKKIKKIACFY